MPRKSALETAFSRQSILTSAARLMRERGYAGVGIEAITSDAGLTVGAFYTHFASKEELFAQVVDAALLAAEEHLPTIEKPTDIQAFVRFYLSDKAVNDIGSSCIVAAMSADLSRDGGKARRAAAAYIELIRARIEKALPNRDFSSEQARDEAWRIVAQTVGALVIARIIEDPKEKSTALKANKSLAVIQPG
jgi:TetR/AcrR family transcriptional regulator, transcriptional repressor for nem operon